MLGGGATLAWTPRARADCDHLGRAFASCGQIRALLLRLKAAAAAAAVPARYALCLSVRSDRIGDIRGLPRSAAPSSRVLCRARLFGLAAVAALFLIMPFLDVAGCGLMTAAILGFLGARRVFLHEPACVRVPPRTAARVTFWHESAIRLSQRPPFNQRVLGLNPRAPTASNPARRIDQRGRRIAGAAMLSIITLTQAGLPLASARSIAPGRSAARSTSSPWPPSAATTWS